LVEQFVQLPDTRRSDCRGRSWTGPDGAAAGRRECPRPEKRAAALPGALLRDENNGASAPGPADHACSVLPLALRGQGAHTPGPPSPPCRLPRAPRAADANFSYRLASTRRIRPPRGPACRQSRITLRRRCASAGSRFRPWRNRRDDAGQARCPVHRACCLFLALRSLPRLPAWCRSGFIRLRQAFCGTARRRTSHHPPFLFARSCGAKERYASGASVSFCIQ